MFFSRFSSCAFPSVLQGTRTRNDTERQGLEGVRSEGWVVKRAGDIWHVFHPDLNPESPHLHRMRNITTAKAVLACILQRNGMVLAKSVTNYLVNKYSDSCENKGLLKKTANIRTPNLEEDRHFSCHNSNPSWPAKLIYVSQSGALQPNAPESLHQYGKPAHIINANSVHGQVSSVLNTAKSATTILCNSFTG